ncbi:unnamed protein product [Paramecium primaurelia]|uniref:Anoctamin transmembrane domain-containing protein n=1 Tax=Paramecium primaurelia TaxID=5886 RepID=A0A8S1QGM1_PARPR|nr:unnamed protein product [Paramecium primaurelia]
MYEVALLFNEKISPDQIKSISKLLNDLGFGLTVIIQNTSIIMMLYLRNNDLLLQTLSDLHIELPKYSKKSHQKSILVQNRKKFEKYRLFIRIREFLDKNIKEMEQYSKFKYDQKQKFENTNNVVEIDSYLREIAIYQILATLQNNNQINPENSGEQFLFVALKQQGILLDICPMRTFRHSTYKELKQCLQMNVNVLDYLVVRIRSQMGEQIAFYFGFLLYLIKNMLILVVFGMITYSLDEYFDYDVTKSPFEPLYAALTVLWAAYFVSQWNQKQKEYQVRWRSHGKNYDYMQSKMELSLLKCLKHKNHFSIQESTKKIVYSNELDPVTGQKIQIKQNIFSIYLNSIIRIIGYVIALVIFLIASLNMRGYVDSKQQLYIEFIQIPNCKNIYISYLLAIIHVVVVNYLNSKYKQVSITTSLSEDHKCLQTFERSLIIKRFTFEIFSAFFDFFYIGFVNDDINQLKQEMIQMFMVDEFRRIMTETILPSISKLRLIKYQKSIVKGLSELQQDTICQEFQMNNHEMQQVLQSQLISCFLPKYESFDDYLEIILNFGYVCFFTSAVRMAGIVVTTFLFIEFFSDYYKIYHLYQKPFAIKSNSIGPWTKAMDIICVISVFTNLMLFSVASDQIVKFFPSLFEETNTQPSITQSQYDEIEDNEIKIMVSSCGLLTARPLPNKSSQATLVVILIEHILLILIYFIKKIISLRQTWVDIYLKRQEYKRTLKE